MESNNLLVCVSGGRSSAMMAFHIHTSLKYQHFNKLFVFCNTGLENIKTINFLKDIINFWDIPLVTIECVSSDVIGVGVSYSVVSLDSVNMSGVPMHEAIKQMNKYYMKGVPNMGMPYCSDYLKRRPAHAFARDFFKSTKYITAIGFRKEDMPKRITFQEIKEDNSRIYPLLSDFEKPIEIKDINTFFSKQKFSLHLDKSLGNCELCWKKSDSVLFRAVNLGASNIQALADLEKKYGTTFFRNNKSMHDIISMAKSNDQKLLFEDDRDSCICSF